MNLEMPQTPKTRRSMTALKTMYHHQPGLLPSCDMMLTFIPKSDCFFFFLMLVRGGEGVCVY